MPAQVFSSQVEQAQAGLESLSLSQKTISQLRENFLSIEKYKYDSLWHKLIEAVLFPFEMLLFLIFILKKNHFQYLIHFNLESESPLPIFSFLLQVMSRMPNINRQSRSDKAS